MAPPVTFKERLNTVKVRHAIVQGGQVIMLFVFNILFLGGDLKDVSGYVHRTLGSNTKYNKIINKTQHEKLNSGDSSSWDVSLLFQLLQKFCGLKDPNVDKWGSLGGGSLENLLQQIKELRNDMAHDMDTIYSKDVRDQKLEEIRNLCYETLRKLEDKAPVSQEDIYEHHRLIDSIIEDAKEDINETIPDENIRHAKSAVEIRVAEGGYVADCFVDDSMESSDIDKLISSFWKYAGRE
ncbi:unnamed protein product [Meganyctiphanes norvegica]|uniref:DZIP3-like HEPN domain-containing protein n=1 Tax=Meganyctiphanes norvegica TaxID=48144 RepID=A0AAV2Q8V0_MEGNR